MSAVKGKVVSLRYMLAKAAEAGLESMYQFGSTRGSASAKQPVSFSEALTAAKATFSTVYGQPLTTVMYMAGAAMAPTLNKRALKDADEVEKLVVRRLPRPSTRNVLVGDVVAFNSPLALAQSAAQAVMVRRVAAVAGTEMVSDSADDTSFTIQADHFWALGDNEAMSPPDMIDSRTFGAVPMRNIIGRVIYTANTASDHAPVVNHPMSMHNDAAIVEQEVDVDQLWPAGASGSGSAGRSSDSSSGSTPP